MPQQTDTSEQPTRDLNWPACYNARDLGGYATSNGGQTRWHALVRTDNHFSLTPEGQAALRDYGIRTVIDLRMPRELESHPNPFAAHQTDPTAPRYFSRTVMDQDDHEADAAMQASASMLDEYIVIVERNKPRISDAVKAVASSLSEGGVVVHCRGGKDRTGILIALLLSVAGVPRDLIVEDYAVSSPNLEPIHQRWMEEQAQAQGHPVYRPRWMDSHPETMQGTLDYLDHTYGGPESFLLSIGVTPEEIALIRRYLVEPAPIL
ncbi:MAG: tyrosine-protein phosphatase [Chloroflexia bacterium]